MKLKDNNVYISNEFLSSFVKVTSSNIKDIYGANSLFIISEKVNNKIRLLNIFYKRPKMVKNQSVNCYFMKDKAIFNKPIKAFTTETDDEYKIINEDLVAIIKIEIKNGRLYAKKL